MVSTPSNEGSHTPTPPPLPTPLHREPHPLQSHFKIAEKESGFWKKFQQAQGAFYQSSRTAPFMDPPAPPTGPYFFYGTLMDPSMLMEILDLKERPTLRPAKIVGYSCKLWGQYPALIDGPKRGIVEGAVFEVQTEKHAARLAEYETKAYSAVPCEIQFMDDEQPFQVFGTTFRYAGPELDLDCGDFDLKTWLSRMGRGGIINNLDSRKATNRE